MKVFVVIAATLALFGTSLADEDKKTKIINFYSCIACAKDPVVREEYMKCSEMKPEKCKKIADDCKSTLMPGLTTAEERWEKLCTGEDGIQEKLYDCVMNDESRKDLTDDEKTQLKEFKQCAKKVGKKYCESH